MWSGLFSRSAPTPTPCPNPARSLQPHGWYSSLINTEFSSQSLKLLLFLLLSAVCLRCCGCVFSFNSQIFAFLGKCSDCPSWIRTSIPHPKPWHSWACYPTLVFRGPRSAADGQLLLFEQEFWRHFVLITTPSICSSSDMSSTHIIVWINQLAVQLWLWNGNVTDAAWMVFAVIFGITGSLVSF